MSDRDRYDEAEDEPVEYDGVDDYDRNRNGRGTWVSALIAVAGVWLLLQAFLFEILAANFWNDVVVGLALVAIGGYNVYRRADDRAASTAAAALAALFGLWLMVSPYLYDEEFGFTEITTQVGYVNDLVVGVLVLVLGIYSVVQARSTDATTPT